jgi:hypothetical protein
LLAVLGPARHQPLDIHADPARPGEVKGVFGVDEAAVPPAC